MIAERIKVRFGTWGIFILMLWALIMVFLAVAEMLGLMAIAEFGVDAGGPSPTQIWITFFLNILFMFGFGASVYGLYQRRNWGRVIFLWSITIWSGVNIIALFILWHYVGQKFTVTAITANVLRYVVSLLLPLWYLNLSHIKMMFTHYPSENFTSEESVINDNN